jgi:hypothetical protein
VSRINNSQFTHSRLNQRMRIVREQSHPSHEGIHIGAHLKTMATHMQGQLGSPISLVTGRNYLNPIGVEAVGTQ